MLRQFSDIRIKRAHGRSFGIGEFGPEFVAAGLELELEGDAPGIGFQRQREFLAAKLEVGFDGGEGFARHRAEGGHSGHIRAGGQ